MFITPEAKKLINDDIAIDRLQLIDENARTPKLLTKYMDAYLVERNKFRKLQREYDSLYLKRRLFYLGKASDEEYNNEPLDKKVMRQEVEIWLKADKQLQGKKEVLDTQEAIVDFLEKVIRDIERRSYAIKNMIEMIRFESGG